MSADLMRRANDVPHGLFCPGRFPDSKDRCTCPRKTALDLASRLARAEGLLREAQDYLTEDEPQGSLRDCIDAYFAEQEPRT